MPIQRACCCSTLIRDYYLGARFERRNELIYSNRLVHRVFRIYLANASAFVPFIIHSVFFFFTDVIFQLFSFLDDENNNLQHDSVKEIKEYYCFEHCDYQIVIVRPII